jgi:molybdopterin biosynthesis enzyme
MPTPRKRPDVVLRPATLKIAEDELDAIREVAEREGVTVSHLLRAAGTAVVGDEDLLRRALDAQSERDSLALEGVRFLPKSDGT